MDSKIIMPPRVLILHLLVCITIAGATFLEPGDFQNLTVQELTVTQTCADELMCHSDSYNAPFCEEAGVCSVTFDCNGREDFPAVEHPLQEWQASLENNTQVAGCTVVDGPPKSPPPALFQPIDSLILLVNGSAAELEPCFVQKADQPNSSFSLVMWMRATCNNCSILEMPQADTTSIHLRVVQSSICVNSICVIEPLITNNDWVLITVRVYDGNMMIFVGDDPLTFPDVQVFEVSIQNLYIGSSEIIATSDIFELYDVRYYTDALTGREIGELVTGMLDPSLDFSECRCPGAYPFLETHDTNLCTDGITTTFRFNTSVQYNQPDVMLDGDSETRWASSDEGNVSLTLDMGMSFEIQSITVSFASTTPVSMEALLLSGGVEKASYSFVCSGMTCDVNMVTNGVEDMFATYIDRTAEEIQIILYRKTSGTLESFGISNVFVFGRCDCHGNANNCNYTDEGFYTCDCAEETNSQGPNCETCQTNFYSLPDEFGCRNGCSCYIPGVIDASDACDQVTGICFCKSNVEGTACDTCKDFTYNLEISNPDGCTPCDCDMNGAESCSPNTGECVCKNNTALPRCDGCTSNSYGFNSSSGCLPCACNLAGITSQPENCSEDGQCHCKDNVMGLKCDQCTAGSFGLDSNNPQGCQECECHPIGTAGGTCNSQSGDCTCRNGDTTNPDCTPVLSSIDPTYGPEFGGTLITIKGQLLGDESQNTEVYLDDKVQEIISVNDNQIVFKTKQYESTGGANKSPQLKLGWDGVSVHLSTALQFQYLPNPTIDQAQQSPVITYNRGGCHVKIYGSNLKNVKYPLLQITNAAVLDKEALGACKHLNDHILCTTPDLSDIRATSGSNTYEMKLMLDGLVLAQDMAVLADPKIDDVGNIKFQYPFEDTEDLSGTSLKSSCPVSISLGVVSCEIKHISDTGIEFEPPPSPPGGQMKHTIEVKIGDFHITPGTLEYLELYETTGFIIIASCVGACILIAVVLAIICCCYRRRRHSPPSGSSKLNSSIDEKPMTELDSRPMNTYSELVTLVDAPDTPAVSNSHNGSHTPVRVESVVREYKKGIVNSEAEDLILVEEFLPRVEPGLRDEVKRCYVGNGHFVPGRTCYLKGKHTQLVDGTLNRDGVALQKLTIKSVTDSLTEHELPMWINLALGESLRLRKLQHTHILNIVGIGANKEQLHILYPHMSQGVLKTLVSDTTKDFSVRQLLGFSQQVAEGINFLASKDITHKDVAARNCLVDDFSVVKLGDASFSWEFFPQEYVYDQSRERYLPMRWMAPESISDGYYDMRTDVWSFAVLVWELLTRGCLPFHEVTESAEVSDYIMQGYILGRPDTLSVEVYELLRNCWSPENESRPSIALVARTLGEILEGDDDDTYENAGELASFQHQRSSGMAASPRHHNGNIYSTTSLSRV